MLENFRANVLKARFSSGIDGVFQCVIILSK